MKLPGSLLTEVVHIAKVMTVFYGVQFKLHPDTYARPLPSGIFNTCTQGPGLVEHPGVTMVYLRSNVVVTGSIQMDLFRSLRLINRACPVFQASPRPLGRG